MAIRCEYFTLRIFNFQLLLYLALEFLIPSLLAVFSSLGLFERASIIFLSISGANRSFSRFRNFELPQEMKYGPFPKPKFHKCPCALGGNKSNLDKQWMYLFAKSPQSWSCNRSFPCKNNERRVCLSLCNATTMTTRVNCPRVMPGLQPF